MHENLIQQVIRLDSVVKLGYLRKNGNIGFVNVDRNNYKINIGDKISAQGKTIYITPKDKPERKFSLMAFSTTSCENKSNYDSE